MKTFWRSFRKEKETQLVERGECYFDECSILNKHIMCFKNESRLINYQASEIIKYKNIEELIASNSDINVIIRSVISTEIISYIYENYRDHFVNITADKNSLQYTVQVIEKSNLIRLFSDISAINDTEILLDDSIGFRYINEYKESGVVKYKCMSLHLGDGNQILNGEPISMMSNFKSLLDIFDKNTNEVTDIFLVNDQFVKTINKNNIVGYKDILKCILGDNNLKDYIKFDKIF